MPLRLAVAGYHQPAEEIRKAGWQLVPGIDVSLTAEQYHQFIQGSAGEWSIAKNVFVATRSGWFSCRTACYLAAGRPVITQDTAFGNILPTGKGLFAFTTQDEALAAIQDIAGDYEAQSQAASDIANDYFAAEKVVGGMASKVGLL